MRSISITSWSTNIIFSTFWWANHRSEQATLWPQNMMPGTEVSFPIKRNRRFGWKGYLSWNEIAMWKTTFPGIKQLKHTLGKWNCWVEIDVWIRVTLQKLNFYEKKKATYNLGKQFETISTKQWLQSGLACPSWETQAEYSMQNRHRALVRQWNRIFIS